MPATNSVVNVAMSEVTYAFSQKVDLDEIWRLMSTNGCSRGPVRGLRTLCVGIATFKVIGVLAAKRSNSERYL